jgi:hypothetical protein
MSKLFPIILQVEEIAVGSVLRKLNEMPGVAKIDLNLGHGGEGAGKKALTEASSAIAAKGTIEKAIANLLLSRGAMALKDITATLRANNSTVHNALTRMRKKGLTESYGRGIHRLTLTSRNIPEHGLAPPLALPAPGSRPVLKRVGKSHRVARGSGPILIKTALAAGPLGWAALRDKIEGGGLTHTSAGGAIGRAKRAGLIRKNGAGFVLTPKGQKINEELANG